MQSNGENKERRRKRQALRGQLHGFANVNIYYRAKCREPSTGCPTKPIQFVNVVIINAVKGSGDSGGFELCWYLRVVVFVQSLAIIYRVQAKEVRGKEYVNNGPVRGCKKQSQIEI